MTFAEKLKQLREQAGMTQTGLAGAAGMPLGTLRDYEQGKRRMDPSLSTAVRLARALGVSVAAFAGCVSDSGSPRKPRGRPRSKAK